MDDVKKIYLSWQEVTKIISGMMPRLRSQEYDLILAITRGGIIPSALISERLMIQQVMVASIDFYMDEEHDLDWPVCMQFPADHYLRGKQVLVVDDIWDRGREMVSISDRVKQAGGRPFSAVLHYKPHRSHFPNRAPTVYGAKIKDWVIYPWEIDRDVLGV